MNKLKRTTLLSTMLLFSFFSYATTYFNVKEYGATGNDTTLDTDAVNKAITRAAETGGGTVFFPAGTYLCYSIHLKSNVSLYLDNGCTILAADYTPGQPGFDATEGKEWSHYQDFGHTFFHNSLMWGENLENITISGQGLINGKGLTREEIREAGAGNKAIALKLCRNVTIRDISILMGGHFAILATGVDLLTLDNLKVDTNRDAFDIDCCHHVRVSNCTVNSPYDDAICLKSSYALGYARTTEDVTITNCYVSGFDRTTLLNGTYLKNEAHTVPDKGVVTGRIKFGTESNGGFRNITVSNCTFEFCRGLALETVDGGILEDITVSNITMKDIQGAPFFLRLGARMRGPQGVPVGKLRRINISNIIVYSENPFYCSMIAGIPGHEIEDVRMSDITIRVKGGAPASQALNVVEEHIKTYPDPQEFGAMPAYGFFIRHARNIELNNIRILLENSDARPAIILDDAHNVTFNNVELPTNNATQPIRSTNSENTRLNNCNFTK